MALENFLEMRDTVRDPKFMLRKELSFELERRHPHALHPALFDGDVPPRDPVPRRRTSAARVQARILAQLTEHATSLAEIPAAQMDALVQRTARAACRRRASLPD